MNIENNYCCIYKITSPTGKIYIGQTVNLKNRIRKYRSLFFKGQLKLWNNCQKYNWNPKDFIEIIEECTTEDLDKKEIYWIQFYNSFNEGLNCDLGGAGRKGYKPTEATKEKLRQANLGKKHTQEAKNKISKTLKELNPEIRKDWIKPWEGKNLSLEHIEKIKQSKKDNPFKMTQEQKYKVSKANLGNTKMLGKHHSDESKQKISAAKKGKILTCYNKQIINITTGEIYNSQTEAAEKLNTTVANILRVCRGDRKTCKGVSLEYFKDKNEEDCCALGGGNQ